MWGGALLSLKITINSQQSLDVAVTFQFPVVYTLIMNQEIVNLILKAVDCWLLLREFLWN